MGGNQTRPDKPHKSWLVAELKQVIAEIPHESSAARRGSRGMNLREPTSAAYWFPLDEIVRVMFVQQFHLELFG